MCSSDLGAFVVGWTKAEFASDRARKALRSCQVSISTTGTAAPATVGYVVEEESSRAASTLDAPVSPYFAGLADEGARLAFEVDAAADELPFGTAGRAGVFSNVLVEHHTPVVAGVAALAIEKGGAIASEAALSTRLALAVGAVHVGPCGTHYYASAILQIKLSSVKPTTGCAIEIGRAHV